MGKLAALAVALAAVALLAGCERGERPIRRDVDEGPGCYLTWARVGFGQVLDTWECFNPNDRNQAMPLVTLTRLGGQSEGYGEVHVGGEVQPAAFRIDGLDSRWDFGCDEREPLYPYAFVIEHSAAGLYFDFRASDYEETDPRRVYACVMVP